MEWRESSCILGRARRGAAMGVAALSVGAGLLLLYFVVVPLGARCKAQYDLRAAEVSKAAAACRLAATRLHAHEQSDCARYEFLREWMLRNYDGPDLEESGLLAPCEHQSTLVAAALVTATLVVLVPATLLCWTLAVAHALPLPREPPDRFALIRARALAES